MTGLVLALLGGVTGGRAIQQEVRHRRAPVDYGAAWRGWGRLSGGEPVPDATREAMLVSADASEWAAMEARAMEDGPA